MVSPKQSKAKIAGRIVLQNQRSTLLRICSWLPLSLHDRIYSSATPRAPLARPLSPVAALSAPPPRCRRPRRLHPSPPRPPDSSPPGPRRTAGAHATSSLRCDLDAASVATRAPSLPPPSCSWSLFYCSPIGPLFYDDLAFFAHCWYCQSGRSSLSLSLWITRGSQSMCNQSDWAVNRFLNLLLLTVVVNAPVYFFVCTLNYEGKSRYLTNLNWTLAVSLNFFYLFYINA